MNNTNPRDEINFIVDFRGNPKNIYNYRVTGFYNLYELLKNILNGVEDDMHELTVYAQHTKEVHRYSGIMCYEKGSFNCMDSGTNKTYMHNETLILSKDDKILYNEINELYNEKKNYIKLMKKI